MSKKSKALPKTVDIPLDAPFCFFCYSYLDKPPQSGIDLGRPFPKLMVYHAECLQMVNLRFTVDDREEFCKMGAPLRRSN